MGVVGLSSETPKLYYVIYEQPLTSKKIAETRSPGFRMYVYQTQIEKQIGMHPGNLIFSLVRAFIWEEAWEA